MNRLGRTLRKFRKKHGLTQKQLAERLELERCSLAHIEAGKGVSTDTLKRISQVLAVPAGDLL